MAAGAVAEPNGRYSLKAVLVAWERCAAGRVGVIDAAAAKLVLANLKIERETLSIRQVKAELVEVAPYEQYMGALAKVLWGALQSVGLSTEQLDHCRRALNMATAEFVRGYPLHRLLTLDEQEQYAEGIDKKEPNEQITEQSNAG